MFDYYGDCQSTIKTCFSCGPRSHNVQAYLQLFFFSLRSGTNNREVEGLFWTRDKAVKAGTVPEIPDTWGAHHSSLLMCTVNVTKLATLTGLING